MRMQDTENECPWHSSFFLIGMLKIHKIAHLCSFSIFPFLIASFARVIAYYKLGTIYALNFVRLAFLGLYSFNDIITNIYSFIKKT